MQISSIAAVLGAASLAVASVPANAGAGATEPTLVYTGTISTLSSTSSIAGQATSSSSLLPVVTSSSQSTLSPSVGKTESAHAAPNATGSQPVDQTGGAILPHMQGSMVGLLGFCIMSLIML